MLTDFLSLVQALQNDGASLQANPAAGVIQIPVTEAWMEGVLWLRWDQEYALLHVLLPLPTVIPFERITAIESLITHLNHRLKMPGFGLDHEQRKAYFRLTVPRGLSGALLFLEVRKLLGTTVETVRDFAPMFEAVAQGGKSVAEALTLSHSPATPFA